MASVHKLVPVSRRLAIGGGLAVAATSTSRRFPLGAEVPVVPRDLAFDVLRKGERIGTNEVRFRQSGGGDLEVTTRLDLEVKVLFAVVFRYRQEAKDLWRDGRLVASDIETDDDGERTTVRVREAGDGRLTVEGPAGSYAAEAGTMTDLSFWNPAIVRQTRIIDGQNAELTPITLTAAVRETVAAGGGPVAATRHGFATTRGREGSVWYDAGGRWVRAEYVTRGEPLAFESRG
ncbi:MAG TPA: DUF6134 family protein [Geminicoccaceae bacterium]